MTTRKGPTKGQTEAFFGNATNAELLRGAVDSMNRRREEDSAEAGALIRQGGVPVSDDVLERLSFIPREHADVALREHPGHAVDEAIHSYTATVEVLATATHDLVDQIDAFETRAQNGEFFAPYDQDALKAIERTVQKELFAAASAAHAVVDHARGLSKLTALTGYDQKRAQIFGDDGLHELIIGLRTILHHVTALKAGWHVVTSSPDEPKKADFRLNRKMLSRTLGEADGLSKGQKDRINAYLGKGSSDIDLRAIFPEYLKRVHAFEAWLVEASHAKFAAEIGDLVRCRSELQKAATRTWWNMLIGNWASTNFHTPPNPYNHLWKYLKPHQLDELETLEMGSTPQIDRIIEIVDYSGACDIALRKLIYRYFDKAVSVHGLPLSIPRSAPPKA